MVMATEARRSRSLLRAACAAVAALIVGGLVGCGPDEVDGPPVADRSSPTSTDPPAAPSAAAATAVVDEVPDGDDAVVVRVVDGDTIIASVGGDEQRVRFIGMDTPESVHPQRAVECFGREASAHTTRLIGPGTAVRLVYDVERTDRFGRTLAYVYRLDDGLFVNLALLLDGYAQVATFPPNVAHVQDFRAAQRAAREADRGLWSACEDEGAGLDPDVADDPGALDDPSVVATSDCTARMSEPEPTRHSSTRVEVESELADRPVAATAHYRTTSTTNTGRTGTDGAAVIELRIGGATVDVPVTVEVSVDGGRARCRTSFTPR
jgi:micrococcal nuclease